MPVKILTGDSTDKMRHHLTKNYLEKRISPSVVDPIKIEWLQKNFAHLRALKDDIFEFKRSGALEHFTSNSKGVNRAHIGDLILKRIRPIWNSLEFLDYTEIKYLAETGWRAWRFLDSYSFICYANKCRQIGLQTGDIQQRGDEYGCEV